MAYAPESMRWQNRSTEEDCSLSRTLAVIGDRWTLLVLRDAFLRVRRFEDFENSLKIARRVLSERLALLVEEGILRKVPYQERPVRYEYRLTEKGLELYPAIISLVHWGDQLLCDRRRPAGAAQASRRAGMISARCSPVRNAAKRSTARDVEARSTRAGPSRSRKAATR